MYIIIAMIYDFFSQDLVDCKIKLVSSSGLSFLRPYDILIFS